MRLGNNDIFGNNVALSGLGKVGRDFLTPGSTEPLVRCHLGLFADTPPALAAGSGFEIMVIATIGSLPSHLSVGVNRSLPQVSPLYDPPKVSVSQN